MGSVTRPRGRLPQRVYWMRRSAVLVVALLLVFGLGTLVGGLGADSPDKAARASVTDASPGPDGIPTAAATGRLTPVGPVAIPSKAAGKRPSATPLATPSGSCAVDEVTVLPTVPQAPGGGDIPIILQLVGTEPACTFEVSAKTLVVKITKGEKRFWSSQDCPGVIPKTQVVVRSGVPATVPVTWNGRASNEQCSGPGAWAGAGSYRVYAAALGSTPSDVEFEVTQPDAPVKTKTVGPKPKRQQSPGATPAPGTPSPSR